MQYKLLQTVTDFEIVLFILLRMASACEHTEYSQPDLASTLPYLYTVVQSPFDVCKKDLCSKAQDRLKKSFTIFAFLILVVCLL